MANYNSNPSRYTPEYLKTLSPAYRRRIESYLRRNPGASVTSARGHRPSLSEIAVRARQDPLTRYSPEYLQQLSPSYRRQIERELRRSQETQSRFIMPGSQKRTAFRLYAQHLTMLGISLDKVNDKTPGEYTLREEFENSWKLVRGVNNREAFISLQKAAIQKTLNYKRTHEPQPDISDLIGGAELETDNYPVEIDGETYIPDDYDFDLPDDFDIDLFLPEDQDMNEYDWESVIPSTFHYYHSI